jgi:type II secretory pathway pseudopilin PulG
MMLVAIIILSILVVVLGFTTFNLLKKNEKQEDILMGYMSYLNKFSDYIEETEKRLKEIDQKGSFETDDEVGFFFEQLKNIQSVLNSFNVKNL